MVGDWWFLQAARRNDGVTGEQWLRRFKKPHMRDEECPADTNSGKTGSKKSPGRRPSALRFLWCPRCTWSGAQDAFARKASE